MTDSPVTVLGRAIPGDHYHITVTDKNGKQPSLFTTPLEIELTDIGNDVKHLSIKFTIKGTKQVIAVNRNLDDGRVQVLFLYPRSPAFEEVDQPMFITRATPIRIA